MNDCPRDGQFLVNKILLKSEYDILKHIFLKNISPVNRDSEGTQ